MTTRRPPTLPENPWADLTGTQRRIVLELLRHGRLSRPQIMEAVGISPASITRLTAPLVASGLLTATAEQVAATGRPQTPLEVRAEAESIMGATLSVTSLTVVVTDLTLTPHASVQVPLGSRSPDDVVALLKDTVAEAVSGAGRLPPPACAGISLGGATRGGRVVGEATFYGWSSVPLARLAEEALGVPCTVANDLVALTLGEAWFGAGRGKDPFAMVTLGAGIGCGVVVAGEVVSGAQGAAGSVGHLPVDPSGPSCEIGHPGCARALASTPGILRAAAEHLECEAGELSLDLLLSPDKRRHNGVDDVLRRAVLAIGRVVGTLIAYVDPELVVVSGEGVAVVETYREVFDEEVGGLRHWAAAPVPVLLRPFEFDEWARGAAALALDQWTVVAGGR